MRNKDNSRYGFVEKHEVKIKFVIVGIWNTIFGYLVYVGFYYMFNLIFSRRYMAYLLAAVLSNILAITNAYIFHKYVTFRSPVKGIKMALEFIRFFTTYLFSFILSLVLLPLVIESFLFDPRTAGAVVIFMTAIISYIGHSNFSFKLYKKLS
jgi:putative flippase GtrA